MVHNLRQRTRPNRWRLCTCQSACRGSPPPCLSSSSQRWRRAAVGRPRREPPPPAAVSGAKLSLVAYSTPKEAYEELIPAFQKTADGKGVSFTQSYGASGDQSRAVASGLPADVVALSLAPDVDKLVEPGIVDANWADTPTRRLRDQLGRRARRPQGQPEGHQDLGGHHQGRRRGHHAEPVHLGRREVEPDGRLRLADRPGQVARGGDPVPARRARQHRGPGQVGPRGAADVRRRQGRRADRLRERGDHRAERRRSTSTTWSRTRRS